MGVKEITIIRLDDLTDEQRKAYALAHNKLTMNSDFDVSLLDTELAEIETIDMTLLGFDDKEAEPIETQEDSAEIEIPDEPKSKLGDLYQLGNHRLYCGDSTKEEDVKCLLGGDTAKLLFTSPPYSDMREYEGGKDLSVDNLIQFIKVYKPYADVQCVNLGLQFKNKEVFPYWNAYIDLAHDCGMKLLAWNVWNKTTAGSIGMQKHMFPVIHEWIFCFGEDEVEINKTWAKKENSIIQNASTKMRRQADGSMKPSSNGDASNRFKSMESVIECYAETGAIRKEHPATFPVKLPSEYIQALTDEGDNVIEPFGGSGTTLIACEQTNRNCFCMELEPKYVDVIINRWETLTGKKAVKLNAD
jgi:DNA modification methylase